MNPFLREDRLQILDLPLWDLKHDKDSEVVVFMLLLL